MENLKEENKKRANNFNLKTLIEKNRNLAKLLQINSNNFIDVFFPFIFLIIIFILFIIIL